MAGVVQRFEQRLESVVTGAFARAFRSAVQPVEIAAALQREVDNSAHVLSREKLLVPNIFTVQLSAQDFARLIPFGDTLSAELARLVEEHVAEQRYTLTGPVTIGFDESPDLVTGRFRVSSDTSAGVAPGASGVQGSRIEASNGERKPMSEKSKKKDDAPATPAGAVTVEVNGSQHAVPDTGLVIGRGKDADLQVNDPGISRQHARLDVTPGVYPRVTITDLDSTNGVLLDGRRVIHTGVADGATLQLGSTQIVLHITAPGLSPTDG